MKLTGYSDVWTVRPGGEIAFHVHTTEASYDARLVRLIHGDENPRGPGFKEIEVGSVIDGTYPGLRQVIKKGSYGLVPLGGVLDGEDILHLAVWLWPTLPGPDAQGVVSWLDPAKGEGFGLFLSADGHLECRQGGAAPLRGTRPLAIREWYRVDVLLDGVAGRIAMTTTAGRWQPSFDAPDKVESALDPSFRPIGADLLIGAGWIEGGVARGCFNGKIARPRILRGGPAGGGEGPVLADWDFAAATETTRIVDSGGSGLHGRTINRPARGMTGPAWPGSSTSTERSAETHDAIHFHDDDVSDVGWPVSLQLRMPDDLPSGVYALRLTVPGAVDHLPFFVAPPRSGPHARLAVLMPTMSYLAYANESLDVSDGLETSPLQDMAISPDSYAYVAENGLKSTYDLHRDGSGIIHGSRRRPIIDFRPRARCRTFDAPHQFAADLHLIDWLTVKGYDFDVITDDLLHAEGADLLAPYRVVVTGSHPEYWTARMLDARDSWLDGGGRLMYLGGNGFYWVTGVAEDEEDVIEVRRYVGTRTASGDIGEESLSVTGERGGLWRDRGRGPHARVAVGFSGQGFDRGAAYRRTEASFAPAYAWVFDGVPETIIGAGRALVLGHGAAGFEVDHTDARYGTPAHAVVLAATDRFTDAYQGAIETMNQIHPWTGGSHAASGVRSEIVYMPGPNGGAVFAAGSITWSSTLSEAGYDGDTARITRNVLDRFLSEEPLAVVT